MQNKTHINMKYGNVVDISNIGKKTRTVYYFFPGIRKNDNEYYKFIKLLFFILNYFWLLTSV
jgi:hypothetical protein